MKKTKGESEESGMKKVKLNWTKQMNVSDLPLFDSNEAYIKIPKEYLEDSGVSIKEDIILYTRQMVKDQFTYLSNIIKNSLSGWILGCPGTGKSIVTYSFLPYFYNKGFIITWIHFYRSKNPCIVQLKENYKWTRILSSNFNQEIEDILNELDKDKKNIVILDGYVVTELDLKRVYKSCFDWRMKNDKLNIILVISSTVSRGKTSITEDIEFGVHEFFADSWKFEEYISAIKNEDFFNSIKKYLDANVLLDDPISKEELITSKFYYSGGSSRFMFDLPTKSVIVYTDQSIESVPNIIPYIDSTIGDSSIDIVNLLFNIIKINNKSQKSIISQYASTQIAIKNGKTIIKKLYLLLQRRMNPAMDGWMLEIWFFANLVDVDGVKIYQLNKESEIWKSPIINFDPENPPNIQSSMWLKPLKWNQGGYDAVYVDREKEIVKFVQVTREKEHSLKIQYFYNLMKKFAEQFLTKKIEVYLLVPKDQILDFPKNKIIGPRLLEEFDWKPDQTKICGILLK